MGLDNFWKKSFDSEEIFDLEFDPPLKLCGGLFSAHGSDSFRGKVYAEFIEEVSGFSIYRDLNNEEVHKISEKLNNYKEFKESDEISLKEFEDLKRMFKAYAESDAVLIAWY